MNHYVRLKTADLYRPNARFILERQRYQVLTPFGKLGYSQNLHLVERFTRIGDSTLLYEFTVDDPTTWSRPWSAEFPIAKNEALIYEYACHEGNYGMTNLLRGARVKEREALLGSR